MRGQRKRGGCSRSVVESKFPWRQRGLQICALFNLPLNYLDCITLPNPELSSSDACMFLRHINRSQLALQDVPVSLISVHRPLNVSGSGQSQTEDAREIQHQENICKLLILARLIHIAGDHAQLCFCINTVNPH